MHNLINDNRRSRQTISAQAAAQYAEVVRRLAGGDEPDFQEVCVVLTAAGKTANELTADVTAQRRAQSISTAKDQT